MGRRLSFDVAIVWAQLLLDSCGLVLVGQNGLYIVHTVWPAHLIDFLLGRVPHLNWLLHEFIKVYNFRK